MRQIADESHGVGQGHRARGRAQVQLPGRGVERGEQLVGGKGPGVGQRVEDTGLAGIGVAHQRHVEGVAAQPLAPLCLALPLDLVQPFPGPLDTLADHAPIQFDLRLSRPAAVADATALALQM